MPSSAVIQAEMETGEEVKEGREMGSAIWDKIERSESYLVCSMYEEAASLASSVLKEIRDNHDHLSVHDDFQMYDMMESAGMVLVQSLKQLARTSTILGELRTLFVSVEVIPVQVILTGACFQISEGSTLGVGEYLQKFLDKWSYVDEKYYVIVGAEGQLDFNGECDSRFVLGIDKYLEVVELYTVTLLGTVSKDIDLAISWVENAILPEEKRQGLLRRLHSLYSLKASNVSQGSSSQLPVANHETYSSPLDEPNVSEGSLKALKACHMINGESYSKQAIFKQSGLQSTCLWWFRTITLKFGSAQTIISNRNIVLGCLVFLICYVFRRKKAFLQRIVSKQALAIKKTVVDLWQLAFSYQVNPLAAVQPLPAARH